jgi:hypothetical protein
MRIAQRPPRPSGFQEENACFEVPAKRSGGTSKGLHPFEPMRSAVDRGIMRVLEGLVRP